MPSRDEYAAFYALTLAERRRIIQRQAGAAYARRMAQLRRIAAKLRASGQPERADRWDAERLRLGREALRGRATIGRPGDLGNGSKLPKEWR